MQAIWELILETMQKGSLALGFLLLIFWLELRGLEQINLSQERFSALEKSIARNSHRLEGLPPPFLTREVERLQRNNERDAGLLQELVRRVIRIEAKLDKPAKPG